MQAQPQQGNSGARSKRGARSYYKGQYHIAFYEEADGDETLYMGFDNVADICRYLGWPTDHQSMKRVYLTLYKCLYGGENPYTKLIDGVRLRPYLIDMTEEIEEDERRQEEMKKFVKISSTINIEVYPDLSAIDATNPNAPMADRLNVKPNWVYPVLIRQGIHYYPAEVKAWKAVRSLEKKSLLSISQEADEVPEEEKAAAEELLKKISRMNARQKKEAKKAAQPAKPEEAEAE